MIGKFEFLLNIEGPLEAGFPEKFKTNATPEIQEFDNHGGLFDRRLRPVSPEKFFETDPSGDLFAARLL